MRAVGRFSGWPTPPGRSLRPIAPRMPRRTCEDRAPRLHSHPVRHRLGRSEARRRPLRHARTAEVNGDRPWNGIPPSRTRPASATSIISSISRRELGLVLAILPTWGYMVTDARVFNEANAFAYGKWVGERYRGRPNIIWVNGGDRDAIGFEAIWRALGKGLRRRRRLAPDHLSPLRLALLQLLFPR